MPLDYYKILGVLDDAEERMRELNESYSVLSDSIKRK